MVRRLKDSIRRLGRATARFPIREIVPIEVALLPGGARRAHALLQRVRASPAGDRRGRRERSGERVRRQAAQEAAVLVASGIRRHPCQAPADDFRRSRRRAAPSAASQSESSGARSKRPKRSTPMTSRSSSRSTMPSGPPRTCSSGWVRTRSSCSIACPRGLTARRTRGRQGGCADRLARRLDLRPGGEWSDERVIVFTEYRATQNWLVELLDRARVRWTASRSASSVAWIRMRASVSRPHSRRIPRTSPVRMLVATDAASEGIDLQNHCH